MKKILRVISLAVVMVIMCSTFAIAEGTDIYASDYIDSYSAYCHPAGNGRIEVYFSITGDWYMDTIGATSIHLYESSNNGATWSLVKSYTSQYYPSLIGENKVQHGSYVVYNGVAGRQYKAKVNFWAGESGAGDSRSYMTAAVTAK